MLWLFVFLVNVDGICFRKIYFYMINSAGGTITLDYGHHGNSTGETVYTRQLTVPVMLSVRKALDIVEIDALVFRPGLVTGDLEITRVVRDINASEGAGKRCLASFDVRNTWSAPISVEFSVENGMNSQ